MAPPLRIEYERAFYHVTSRGNERKRILSGRKDYDKFKDFLEEAQDKYGYRLCCYVLSPSLNRYVIEFMNRGTKK